VSEYVGFGQLKIVEKQRREEEQHERLEREAREEPATGAPPAADATPTGSAPAGIRPAAANASGMPPALPAAPTQPAARRAPAAGDLQAAGPTPAAAVVEWKRGYLQLPNWLVFNFLPLLRLDERAVWEELYIWTHGFGENPRVVSQKKVCARLGIDEKRLYRIIAKLEAKGFVRNLGGRLSGDMRERGTLFDVRLPELTGAPPAGTAPAAGPAAAAGRAPAAGKAPDMKENLKGNHESTSVYEIRTIAARLFEAHRGESGFDHNRLRELVRDALIGQGRQPDADAIEEAIRGMAV